MHSISSIQRIQKAEGKLREKKENLLIVAMTWFSFYSVKCEMKSFYRILKSNIFNWIFVSQRWNRKWLFIYTLNKYI